jgi:hypothetical protein
MLIKKLRFMLAFAAVLFFVTGLLSCRHSDENLSLDTYVINDYEAQEADTPLEPVNFGYSAAVTVSIPKTRAQNVVLVKINRGNEPVNYTDSGKITETKGGSPRNVAAAGPIRLITPAQARRAAQAHGAVAGAEQGYVHYGPAWEFNNNLPRIGAERAAALIARSAVQQVYSVGNTKNFWIDNVQGAFEQKQGKLLHTSNNADVWALKKNNGSFYISTDEAETLARKFDVIYGYETSLLGYEYGGGPDGNGGVDGNPRVQILVYDIPQNGVAGYFWGKDAFTDGSAVLQNLRSNEAEIFYIDSIYYTDLNTRDSIYSTLVHEFQHMIQFNLKTIKSNYTVQAGTWYNEMLSMIAEDIISPMVGIPVWADGHPAVNRFPTFLTHYWISGITEHNSSSSNVLNHYANNYGFGAYLIRNYGGAPLLRAMVQNSDIDEKSILNAITAVKGEQFSALQFEALQKRLPVAMLNQTPEGYTFRRIHPADARADDYTCYPISILDPNEEYIGTHIFPINTFTSYTQLSKIPARGFICESTETWLNIDQNSQDLNFTISRPANSNIKLYLLVL